MEGFTIVSNNFGLGVLAGVGCLFLLYLIYGAITGDWKLKKLIEGSDSRPSTSKLQWLLWTGVVIFSYVAVSAVRIIYGNYQPISDVPQNILIAMGMSSVTMVAAKGITSSFVESGRESKPELTAEKKAKIGLGSIIQDDNGFPDLSKTQLMAWTFIAIVVYLFHLGHQLNTAPATATAVINGVSTVTAYPTLPDIDTALMVLMGLGQGAYLGKKLTTTTTLGLNKLLPPNGPAGIEVTIVGMGFGEKKSEGSQVTIDDYPIQESTWGKTQVGFKIPDKHPNGKAWSAGQTGQKISIGVLVNGQSLDPLPFTVTQ